MASEPTSFISGQWQHHRRRKGKALDAEAKLHEAGRAAVRAGILNIQPSRRA
jgi:hypothetical protein